MLLRQIVNSFSLQVYQVRENVELPTNVIKYVLNVFGIHFYLSYRSLFVVHVAPITSPLKVTCTWTAYILRATVAGAYYRGPAEGWHRS